MATTSSTSRQHKKVLIHVDSKGIEHARKTITEAANAVNIFINTCESDLRQELTDEQKEGCYRRGIHFIEEMVRPMYPFPQGDEDLNLGLLGIRLDGLREFHNRYFHSWARYRQELVDGRFEVVDIDSHPDIQSRYTYAENNREEQAYRQAVKLSNLLNTMDHEGFLSDHSKHLISDAVPVVTLGRDEEGIRAFRPNKSGIRMVKQ